MDQVTASETELLAGSSGGCLPSCPPEYCFNRTDTATNAVDDVIDQARRAYDAGVRQIWLAQQFDHDAISLAGFVGAAVPGLGVGTVRRPRSIPRHPLIVAIAGADRAGGRRTETSASDWASARTRPRQQAFGTAWPNPVGRLREHLQVLRSIFDTGAVDFHGDGVHRGARLAGALPGGTPVPVYVAAMGPKALRVTGELADGTLPYLAGPRTLEEFIVPTIDAGRGRRRDGPRQGHRRGPGRWCPMTSTQRRAARGRRAEVLRDHPVVRRR